MSTYILNMILCSGILYALFALAFRHEKMLMFNRFYLLGALLLSTVIPLITITETAMVQVPSVPDLIQEQNFEAISSLPESKSGIDPSLLLEVIYVLVCLAFLIRFMRNLLTIRKCICQNERTQRDNFQIILVQNKIAPFSFLNNIFLNKTEYETCTIEEEVMLHEIAHVNQKHSWDILFIELLLIVMWFNPFLYLYKRAIKTCHELLADDAVAQQLRDTSRYQAAILARTAGVAPLAIYSTFNFLTTKKRLVMLQKQKNPRKAFVRSLLVMPVLAILVIVFHQKSYAVLSETQSEESFTLPILQGDSLFSEYEKLLDKYDLKGRHVQHFLTKRSQVSKDDLQKMISLFLKLTPEQRNKNSVRFIKHQPPFEKNSISSSDLAKWANPKIYGVWINEKRVPNSTLQSYKNTDFSHVFVSKLSKNAINYGKHYYQVDLMTNQYYEEYYRETKAEEGTYFMVIGFKIPISVEKKQ